MIELLQIIERFNHKLESIITFVFIIATFYLSWIKYKTRNSVMALNGNFGFGNITPGGGWYSPEFNYKVTGSFDNATRVLIFEGQRSIS